MHTLSSARRTCIASASAVECTATVRMPISLQARWILSAISPRLAMRILSNIRAPQAADAHFREPGLRFRLQKAVVVDHADEDDIDRVRVCQRDVETPGFDPALAGLRHCALINSGDDCVARIPRDL